MPEKPDVMAEQWLKVLNNMRTESRMATQFFLQSAHHLAGGILVLRGPLENRHRSATEATYRSERWDQIILSHP